MVSKSYRNKKNNRPHRGRSSGRLPSWRPNEPSVSLGHHPREKGENSPQEHDDGQKRGPLEHRAQVSKHLEDSWSRTELLQCRDELGEILHGFDFLV